MAALKFTLETGGITYLNFNFSLQIKLGFKPKAITTFKTLLDKRRQLKDGTYPLIIRIYNGKRFSNINKENQFDDLKQCAKRNHPNEQLINMRIEQIILQETKLKLG